MHLAFSSLIFLLLLIFLAVSCQNQKVKPPAPYGATPSKAQLHWHQLEYYGFLHFGLNTFTGQEWGYGNVSPEEFNPTNFDSDQIVGTAKKAGMKGLILTCKHHDGFCLWPSEYTDYSVKSSPWKDGKGDVVKEISEACAKYGLKFGVYLSPWDRNHPDYGKPAYIEYYRNQLRELLTNYGPIFEVWFDGANGGTGWYGGADEERKIDRSIYYDWDNTWKIVRELQPDAVIFSDVGPDIRWVGNENGFAGDPCWATYTPQTSDNSQPAPGNVNYQLGQNGTQNGKFWMPAECDVSIRPGWFYHAAQDSLVKSPEVLLDLYFKSVGRGASFLLNIPPNKRGRITQDDSLSLIGFKKMRDEIFKTNLAEKAKLTASNIRGDSDEFLPINLIDGNSETFWTTSDVIHTPELIMDFEEVIVFNVISLQEYLPLGQRIEKWTFDIWKDDHWKEVTDGVSIGSKRLWKGELQSTHKIRLRIVESPVCPTISEFGVYLAKD
ncbi:MAG: alpha-L-fucosidase [Bacteroidales bacterium]|nr:alpha-L-fucosidase [Bacteroidales bacterium]